MNKSGLIQKVPKFNRIKLPSTTQAKHDTSRNSVQHGQLKTSRLESVGTTDLKNKTTG